MRGGLVRNALAAVCLLFSTNIYSQSTSCAEVNFNHGDTLVFNCLPNDTCIGLNASLPDIRQTVNAANAYLVNTAPYSGHYPFQIAGATSILVNQDDVYSDVINLPFTFCYYGGQYSQVVIGANGTLSFHALYANQSSGFEMCSNGTWYPGPASPGLPNSFTSSQWGWDSYPRNAIFACFQDLDPSIPAVNKGIEWKLEGTAPCRKLIVNWRNIPQFSCNTNTTTFQCVLYENTNVIEIYLAEKPVCSSWNCGYALIGIQNDARNLAVTPPGRNGAVWTTTTATSEAWRFVPNGPSLLEQVVLMNSTNQVVDTGTVSIAQPGVLAATFDNACVGGTYGNTAKYYVKANYTSCSNPLVGFGALDSIVLIKTPFTPSPVAPAVSYCQNQSTVPLTATGSNLLWFTQPTGGTGSATAPTPSSAVAGTFTWYVSQTINNCQSLRTPVTVTIHPYITAVKNVNICPGQSYTFNGQTYTTAQTGLLDTFATAGCDSIVTLNINVIPFITNTVNATMCQGQSYTYNNITYTSAVTGSQHTFPTSGGCDSVVTFNLSVIPFVTGTIMASICQGQTYTYNGVPYNVDTTFIVDTFQTVSGCDSIVTLMLNVTPYQQGTTNATICQNQSFTFLGNTYTSSFNGNVDTVQTASGCDSIIRLHLTVIPFLTGTINHTMCHGSTYTFNNVTYTSSVSGVTDTFLTAGGCDSIVTLNLTVSPYLTGTVNASICPGQTYLFNGTYYNTAVTTSDTVQTANGCDSIVTLHLTIIPYLTGTLNASICPGQTYTFNNIVYNYAVSGVTDTLISSGGCDSIVSLHLTLQPYLTGTTNATICSGQSYTFNGNTYTSPVSGIIDTFQTSGGCDSINTFSLNVLPRILDTINVFICQGESYFFNGNTYTASISGLVDTFQGPNGCDSIVTLNLVVNPTINLTEAFTICNSELPFTWHGMSVFTGGNGVAHDTIPALKGCDSIFTLNLNILPAAIIHEIDTAGCETLVYEGNTYNQSTTLYENHTYSGFSCDSLINKTNIIIYRNQYDTTFADICIGETYTRNGHDYSSSGVYTDIYNTYKGCDSVSVLSLNVHDLPIVGIDYDNSKYCIYDSVIVSGTGALNYSWTNNGFYNQTGSPVTIPLYYFDNVINVVGKDKYNCADSASIQIETHPCCEMGMPNAFSPNGDGMNDYFMPVTNGNPVAYALYIYNRFGQKIFQSNNIGVGWDGTYNNAPADIGTYHFFLKSECANGEKTERKGNVTLIR
jgi:gliding motility-associated-like protein